MRRHTACLAFAIAVTLPASASADLYNPTTAQYIPTEYYYPAPAPPVPDPPPVLYPSLVTTTASTSAPKAGRRTPKQRRTLGYERSPKLSRLANRQLADLFTKRLGPDGFDRQGFLREANKGTFRTVFRQLVKPLGWSDTDYADALAGFLVSSYMIANRVDELSSTERAGARAIAGRLRAKLLKNRKMLRQSAKAKQLATERLNTVTVIQVVQYANGDEASRAAQATATREAGKKTFKGDLGLVRLGRDGFVPAS